MGTKPSDEKWPVCQSEKVLVLQRRDLVLRIRYFEPRYLNGG